MNKKQVIQKTKDHVKKKFSGEHTGHDWWHIKRVRRMANKLAEEEGADTFVVELAALLHDIADYKFHKGDEEIGPKLAQEWLHKMGVDKDTTRHVCEIVRDVHYKGVGVKPKVKTLEGKVIWDADKLDALGAIGIARSFTTGTYLKVPIHDPAVKPVMHKTWEEYKNYRGTTITHFYEKLLLLKDRMFTKTAKKIARDRHRFIEKYLEQFFAEWEGEK